MDENTFKLSMTSAECMKYLLDQRKDGLLAYASTPGHSYIRRVVSCRLFSKLKFYAPEKTLLENQDSITSFVIHILKAIEQFLLPESICIDVSEDLNFTIKIDKASGTVPLSDIPAVHVLVVKQVIERFTEGVRPFAYLFIAKASAVLDIILISKGSLDFPLDTMPLTKCLTENVMILGKQYREDPLNNEIHANCLLTVLFNLALMIVKPSHLDALEREEVRILDSDITPRIIPPLVRLSRCLWMLTDPAFVPVLNYKGLRTMHSIVTAHQLSATLIGLYIHDLVEEGFYNLDEAYDKILLRCLSLKESTIAG